MNKPLVTTARPAGLPYWARARSTAREAFRSLSEETLHEIAAHRTLQIDGDATSAIFFVVKGWVVSSKSTLEGHRQIIDFALPGDVFDPASARSGQASTDLAALTDTTLSVIPRGDWDRLLRAHPELRQIHDRRMAASYARIAERLLRLGKSRADARIAYAICELCLRSSDLGLFDGEDCRLPLTQQVLGDFVGLSSVHVSRTFRRLRQSGILGTCDQMKIVIHDVERLAEVAEIDLETLRTEIIPSC